MMAYYVEGINYCIEKAADDEEELKFFLSCQFPILINNRKEVQATLYLLLSLF